MAKTLKKKGFTKDCTNKKGQIVKFRVSVKKYPKTNRRASYEGWRVRANAKGISIDKEFKDEWKARAFIDDWQRENNDNLGDWRNTTTRLTSDQLKEAESAFDVLPKGSSLMEAVVQFKKTEEIKEIRLEDAWKEYKKEKLKTKDNPDGSWKSEVTIKEQSQIFKELLIRLGGRIVKSIVEDDLPKFWNKKKSARTRLNRFTKIKSFFKWCVVKRYHFKNPMDDQISPKVLRKTLPKILSIEDCKRLLKLTSKEEFKCLRGFIAIYLFAGCRAGEIHGKWGKEKQLEWKDIQLDPKDGGKPRIILPFVGKQDSNRRVSIPANLTKILLKLKTEGAEIVPKKNGGNRWKQIRKEANLPNDGSVLRHTAISFFYRLNPISQKELTEEIEISDQFGNSTDVRNGHYKNLDMSLADAKAFWKLSI